MLQGRISSPNFFTLQVKNSTFIQTSWNPIILGSLREKNYDQSFHKSGSARVFGYSVFRGVLNRVYGILQLKYGYSVYHFLWISGIKYSKLRLFLGIFGGIWGILGYFVDFFSGILVFHYPPWPTLTSSLFPVNASCITLPSKVIKSSVSWRLFWVSDEAWRVLSKRHSCCEKVLS